MACRKYTISNNGSFTQTYTYQECNNLMWNYDFTIEPGQIRTIWLINGTYTAPATSTLSVVDDGIFPPANSPTPSPTPSITPTISPSISPSPTPSVTPTITPSVTVSITPTNTLTPTPTITPSATPSFNFEVDNINVNGAYIEGITATTGSITTKAGYSYPVNQGDTLYADYVPSSNNLDFDIQIKDPSNLDYQIRVEIDGSTSQTITPGPGDWLGTINIAGLLVTQVITITLENN